MALLIFITTVVLFCDFANSFNVTLDEPVKKLDVKEVNDKVTAIFQSYIFAVVEHKIVRVSLADKARKECEIVHNDDLKEFRVCFHC